MGEGGGERGGLGQGEGEGAPAYQRYYRSGS